MPIPARMHALGCPGRSRARGEGGGTPALARARSPFWDRPGPQDRRPAPAISVFKPILPQGHGCRALSVPPTAANPCVQAETRPGAR